MTSTTAEIASQSVRQKVALLWMLCGLGNTIYAVIQMLTFFNHRNDGSAAASITLDAMVLWYFGITSSLWIVPALSPLVARGRPVIIGSSLLGSFLVVTSVLGGIFDGMRDGLHIASNSCSGRGPAWRFCNERILATIPSCGH
jgi:hypothetical protein